VSKIAPVGKLKDADPSPVAGADHIPAYFGITVVENRNDAGFVHPHYNFNPAEFCHGFTDIDTNVSKKAFLQVPAGSAGYAGYAGYAGTGLFSAFICGFSLRKSAGNFFFFGFLSFSLSSFSPFLPFSLSPFPFLFIIPYIS
jgi:hypothetical protein